MCDDEALHLPILDPEDDDLDEEFEDETDRDNAEYERDLMNRED